MSQTKPGLIALPSARAGCLLAIALCAGRSDRADAQRCLGDTSYTNGRLRIAATTTTTDSGRTNTGEFTAGLPHIGFVGGTASQRTVNGTSARGKAYEVSAGATFDLDTTEQAEACPILSIGNSTGPNLPYVTKANTIKGGVAIGGVAWFSRHVDLIPFGSAMYVRSPMSRQVPFGPQLDTTIDYILFGFGAGIVIDHHLTARPSMAFPFGSDGGQRLLSLSVALNYGGSSVDTWSLRHGSVGPSPCIQGNCTIAVSLQPETIALLKDDAINYRVLVGCPRTLGSIASTDASNGSDVEPLPADWAAALRTVAPLVTATSPSIELPSFTGRYVTIVYSLGVTAVHVTTIDFGANPSQSAKSPFRLSGIKLAIDEDVEKQDQAAIRRCR